MIEFGIYGIYNIVSNKWYVGQTADKKGFAGRWSVKRRNLNNNNKKPNCYLQNAWNKYGENNFKFVVLEVLNVRDKSLLAKREGYWINHYKSNDRKYGYNIRKVSETNLGIKVGPKSGESRKKISEGLKRYFRKNKDAFKHCKGDVWSYAEEICNKYVTYKYKRSTLAKEYNTSVGTIKLIIKEGRKSVII